MKPVLRFLREACSEQDGLGSMKRLLFAAAIVFGLGLLTYDVIGHKGFRSESISVLTIIVGSTAAAYGVTQFAK
jgi:hypothetical protein